MMQVGKAVGMVTLNDALLDLVNKKLVAPDEALCQGGRQGRLRGAAEAREYRACAGTCRETRRQSGVSARFTRRNETREPWPYRSSALTLPLIVPIAVTVVSRSRASCSEHNAYC